MKKFNFKNIIRLFLVFFKAGTFTFAGGLAMLPVIQRDIVDKYQYMPEDEFLEYATLSQTLPGIIALNCAVFVGKRAAGIPGMLAAALGSVLSAFILMIAATMTLEFIPKEGAVAGALQGVRAAAAALILSAAFAIGHHNIKNAFTIAVMIIAFICVLFMNISAVIVIIAAGAAGCVFQKFRRKG